MALSVDGNGHVGITEYLFGCLLMLLIHHKAGFQAMEMVERLSHHAPICEDSSAMPQKRRLSGQAKVALTDV